MNKITLLFALCLLTAFSANAQKLKTAFDLLKQGEYEDAEILFNRAVKKNQESAAAYYGLAQMRFDTASGRKNNQKAFDLFQKSKDCFAKTDPKTVAKIKEFYGIKTSDADSMMREAAYEDFVTAHQTLSPILLNKFKAKYRKIYKDLYDYAVFIEDSVKYRTGCKTGYNKWSFDILKEIEQNEKHPYHDSVPGKVREIQDSIYQDLILSGTIDEMRSFCDTFRIWHTYQIDTADTIRLAAIDKFIQDTSKLKWEEDNLIKKIDEFAPHVYSFEILKYITKPYIEKKDYTKAVNLYMKFRYKFPRQQELIDKIIGLLSDPNPPQIINERKLPPEINSPLYENDYAGIFTPDMKKIYFCQDMDFRKHRVQEDVYVSKFRNGKWQLAEPFGRFASLNQNEAVLHIYPDESQIVLFVSGDLYVSDRQEDGSWSAPYPMKSKTNANGEHLNGFYWQADTYFSADGQILLFSAYTFGRRTDIYACIKDRDGQWGGPMNLGNVINTKELNERSPRLSPDLKTLFFTSDGHYGLGGYDIFMSRRLSDTSWTEWSKPVNMGKNINSCDDEWYFTVGYDGRTIIYNKTDKENKSAIYMGELPEDFRAEATSVLSGRIVSSDGKSVKADIIWEDLKTGTFLGILKNDPKTGEFSITLPLGREYAYFVEADGYCPVSGVFNTLNAKESVFQNDSLTLFSVKEILDNEMSVEIKNVFFDFDKADLKPESVSQIRHIADFFKSNPDLNIEISGHTDSKGSESHNLELSKQRAETVMAELIKLGVSVPKITAKGYGSSKPVSNDDNKNRRVEFKIFK